MPSNLPFDDPDDVPVGGPTLERQAQAYRDSGNAYGPAEPLPGITSGAAPKPWGLNRDQPLYQPPAYYGGFGSMINRNRPADYSVDQRGQVGVPADSYGYRFKGKGAVAPPGGAGAAPDRSMEIQSPRWRPYWTRGGMSA